MDKKKRIIPCLDVKDGRLVKGVNFKNLKDMGDPVEAARYYEDAGADEIALLDITASSNERNILLDLIHKITTVVDVPLIIGGGIRNIEHIQRIFDLGASKVSISSAAVENPQFIAKASARFGQERIIVAIDAKRRSSNSGWDVYIAGGRENTGIDVLSWAKKLQALGAGELLLTSMDKDGTNNGYDIDLTKAVTDVVDIPVIASGGAGSYEDFYDVIEEAGVDAVLAASLFHNRKVDINELKKYLTNRKISVYEKGDSYNG